MIFPKGRRPGCRCASLKWPNRVVTFGRTHIPGKEGDPEVLAVTGAKAAR
ncbi:hypothetical protein SNL152K_6617 [Streptomyces sp. NL15-2K]|nr:hypothetical protein SNL152K_6617 [Streptomyces sp. NL15-2K]